MADAVPTQPNDLEAAAAAAVLAEPHLPGADPAGDPPAACLALQPAQFPPTTLWRLSDAWMPE